MAPDELADATHHELDRLRGQLAGFVEACNLAEKQERAMVKTMKGMTYECEREILKLIRSEA